MKCKMKTFDLETLKGKCPKSCEYGAWNDGICGAECPECGGDLYLAENDKVYCDECGEVNEEDV